jgi:PPK2 family polyphosphate:nucleotide phosphotransferase
MNRETSAGGGAAMAKRNLKEFVKPYRVTDGDKFRLKDFDPHDIGDLESELKDESQELLQRGVQRLAELQDMLYAQDRWAVLLVFQAMDAAGKDSTIKHVMSGVNPQGVQVTSFKVPSSEELDHDFLWRCAKALPERGRIGIFNRSYYEDVLVTRVHPEILESQKIPSKLVTEDVYDERLQDIRAYERYLSRNGTVVLKFFLNVSRKEQLKRFRERLDKPEKNWKFALGDLHEREHWNDYMDAYQAAIRATATKRAPWFVVPADYKWYTRLVVAAAVVDALQGLDLAYPKVDKAKQKELEEARRILEKEGVK